MFAHNLLKAVGREEPLNDKDLEFTLRPQLTPKHIEISIEETKED
jgi:hypothetical protein